MKLNKTVHFAQSHPSSTPFGKESIVEIGLENGSHFTILNDCSFPCNNDPDFDPEFTQNRRFALQKG